MKNKRTRTKNRKGFTLIEMVLVIAITMIIIPMVLATFIIIHRSHENVIFTNDAKDFAYLNQRTIDNILVNAVRAETSSNTTPVAGYSVIHVEDGHQLMVNDTPAFSYQHYPDPSGSGEPKWYMEIEFIAQGNNTVDYTIHIFDRDTGEQFYQLHTSSYLPNAAPDDIIDGGATSSLMFIPLSP